MKVICVLLLCFVFLPSRDCLPRNMLYGKRSADDPLAHSRHSRQVEEEDSYQIAPLAYSQDSQASGIEAYGAPHSAPSHAGPDHDDYGAYNGGYVYSKRSVATLPLIVGILEVSRFLQSE